CGRTRHETRRLSRRVRRIKPPQPRATVWPGHYPRRVGHLTTQDHDIDDIEALEEVQRRVLWLAVRMVDAANHDRPDAGGIKVGGHQASSASMVTLMTALWFAHLRPDDKVAVKPHASPIFHAIQYLLGGLDRSYLPRLRE